MIIDNNLTKFIQILSPSTKSSSVIVIQHGLCSPYDMVYLIY